MRLYKILELFDKYLTDGKSLDWVNRTYGPEMAEMLDAVRIYVPRAKKNKHYRYIMPMTPIAAELAREIDFDLSAARGGPRKKPSEDLLKALHIILD